MDIVVAGLANSIDTEAVGDTGNTSRMMSRDNGLFAQSLHERIANDADSVTQNTPNQGADPLVELSSGAVLQAFDNTATATSSGLLSTKARELNEPTIITVGLRPEEIFQKGPTAGPTSIAGSSANRSGDISHAPIVATHIDLDADDTTDVQASATPVNDKEIAGEEGKGQPEVLSLRRITPASMAITEGAIVANAGQERIAGEPIREPNAFTKRAFKGPDHEAKHSAILKDAKSAENGSVALTKPIDTIAIPMMPTPGTLSVSVAIPTSSTAPVLPTFAAGKQSVDAGGGSRRSSKAIATAQKSIAPAVPAKSKGEAEGHPETMNIADGESMVADAHESVSSTRAGSDSAKAVVSALAGKNDGDGKVLNGGTSAATSHAGAEMAGSSSSLVAGLVPTHVAGAGVLSKVQSADSGALMGFTHTGVPEHEIAGATVSPALDGGHRTLVATPTALEVGISNGSQGWLKIRAEMAGGGGINASLSATVQSGQEMLHRELPSLTAYLQQERVAVNSVVIHAPAASGSSSGVAGGMGGGNRGQPQQRGDEGSANKSLGASAAPNYIEEVGSSSLNTINPDGVSPLSQYTAGGSWLSVRA